MSQDQVRHRPRHRRRRGHRLRRRRRRLVDHRRSRSWVKTATTTATSTALTPTHCESNRKVVVYKQLGSAQAPKTDQKIGTDIAQPNGPDAMWSIGNSRLQERQVLRQGRQGPGLLQGRDLGDHHALAPSPLHSNGPVAFSHRAVLCGRSSESAEWHRSVPRQDVWCLSGWRAALRLGLGQRLTWIPSFSGIAATARVNGPGASPRSRAVSLLQDRPADHRAAEEAQRLGRDADRGGVDERQARGVIVVGRERARRASGRPGASGPTPWPV